MLTKTKGNVLKMVGIKALVAILAVAGAVVLPQIFHLAGAAFGVGTSLGEIFLPMHLPVIIAGFAAGPYVGAIAGIASPLVSFLLTGMPVAAMLPFMMIELCAYGLIAGLLVSKKIPSIVKVLAVQLGGRAVRAVAVIFAVLVLANTKVAVASVWMSVVTGLPGLALQLAIIPFVVKKMEK